MRILTILLLIFTLLFSFGCTSQSGKITANLGQEFELKVGQMASIDGEQIKVKFIEVTDDSR